MRRLLSQAVKATSQPWEMVAPVGGWNTRDSLANMSPGDAIQLDNWFPQATTVDIRPGSKSFATLPNGEVINTLMHCAKADATQKIFAASNTGIWDITAGGTVSATAFARTNGKVEYLNINIAGTPWLWCCNGVDNSFNYNSSTGVWQDFTTTSSPALTGIASNAVTNVSYWKSRVILTEKNSLKFYYLPLNSMGGAATAFDLGLVFKRGGYLVATGNWNLDAGDGIDDLFVAVSSEGEVAIYKGTDPSLSTFNLVGCYHVGRPIGKRCLAQVGGDLAILTESGVWPLSKALLSSTIDRRPAFSDKIREAFNYAYKEYGTLFGWQGVVFPSGPAFLVNIPTVEGSSSSQFVMNLITGAWTRFRGWPASCLKVVGGKLYSAVSNLVHERWTGTADGTSAIVAYCKTAFVYGPGRGRLNHVRLVKPLLIASSSVEVQAQLDTDFEESSDIYSSFVNRIPGSVAIWDSSLWDSGAWGGGAYSDQSWRTVAHTPGAAFAYRMRCSVKGVTVKWAATQFILGRGGYLT